ncbi:MAG: hypothetical protein LBQ52_01170 [Helicobacteraceae bacterium]|jgi:hypothetical protein|nr:hypothetical protein [Helicobacteraceae bacterium]
MSEQEAFEDFIVRFKRLINKNPHLIKTALSNIFTMRLIGNKTHGDLAEIGISEFINQFMYDFSSVHVGKDLYRAKSHEEDIKIINEISNVSFSISLKAYGDGPLQLSTDKNSTMFPYLKIFNSDSIEDKNTINKIFSSKEFSEFGNINVLPLIYDEKNKRCNIMVFDFKKAISETNKIVLEKEGSGRKHPAFRFFNKQNEYICEARYGDASANALQRGLWTNTKNAKSYFNSATSGWIDYSDNTILVKLFSYALVSTVKGHKEALARLANDIDEQKSKVSI